MSLKKLSLREVYFVQDTDLIEKKLNKILNNLFIKGYLEAHYDSIQYSDNNVFAFLNPGNAYHWQKLEFANVETNLNLDKNSKEDYFNNKVVNIAEIEKLIEQQITFYENNGYPFVNIKFNDVRINKDSIAATLAINRNKKITIDTVIISSKKKINEKLLYQLITIHPGDLYNESKIKLINESINDVPYISSMRNFNIDFNENLANIYLYLKKEKNNQFGGIVGFQPNNKTTGKLLITGELKLKLLNSFNHGEQVNFHWKKFDSYSQLLNAAIEYPYLFYSSFGLTAKIFIDKKDTTYVNTETSLGITYYLSQKNRVELFLKNKFSNVSVISSDLTNNIPDNFGSKSFLFGLRMNASKLDYELNPARGYSYVFSLAGGKKDMQQNIVDIGLSDLKQTNHYEIDANLNFYFPVYNKIIGHINTSSGVLSNKILFENETYKLGGFANLKGFDERSINASSYAFVNIELRYLYEQKSNVYLFWNGMAYEKKITGKSVIRDIPYGFGAGVNFSTNGGIFSLAYALGKQFNNSINLKQAKIHIGYINQF
ncbi:MAG: hypothetical protein GXO79_06205 [Chlorobi bacterium]|nr:hypothetical protein [Chlorobiota bacterium]